MMFQNLQALYDEHLIKNPKQMTHILVKFANSYVPQYIHIKTYYQQSSRATVVLNKRRNIFPTADELVNWKIHFHVPQIIGYM